MRCTTDESRVALASNKALSAGVRSFMQAVIIYLLAVLLRVKGKASLDPSGQWVLQGNLRKT